MRSSTRFLLRRRMVTPEIAEAANLRSGIDRAGHDAFKSAASLHFGRVDHTARRLADRAHDDAAIGLQLTNISKNAQNASFAIHVPPTRPTNAALSRTLLAMT